MPSDINESIEEMAQKPVSAKNDFGEVQARPIGEMVEAEQHVATSEALSGTNQNGGPVSGWGCLRIARAKPGGPTS